MRRVLLLGLRSLRAEVGEAAHALKGLETSTAPRVGWQHRAWSSEQSWGGRRDNGDASVGGRRVSETRRSLLNPAGEDEAGISGSRLLQRRPAELDDSEVRAEAPEAEDFLESVPGQRRGKDSLKRRAVVEAVAAKQAVATPGGKVVNEAITAPQLRVVFPGGGCHICI